MLSLPYEVYAGVNIVPYLTKPFPLNSMGFLAIREKRRDAVSFHLLLRGGFQPLVRSWDVFRLCLKDQAHG
jgi:hypothetical protein